MNINRIKKGIALISSIALITGCTEISDRIFGKHESYEHCMLETMKGHPKFMIQYADSYCGGGIKRWSDDELQAKFEEYKKLDALEITTVADLSDENLVWLLNKKEEQIKSSKSTLQRSETLVSELLAEKRRRESQGKWTEPKSRFTVIEVTEPEKKTINWEDLK